MENGDHHPTQIYQPIQEMVGWWFLACDPLLSEAAIRVALYRDNHSIPGSSSKESQSAGFVQSQRSTGTILPLGETQFNDSRRERTKDNDHQTVFTIFDRVP